MPLPSSKEWPHGRSGWLSSFFITFSPEQRNGIVGCIVFENERETATAVAIRDVFGPSNVGMFGLDRRVVVSIHNAEEAGVTFRSDA